MQAKLVSVRGIPLPDGDGGADRDAGMAEEAREEEERPGKPLECQHTLSVLF